MPDKFEYKRKGTYITTDIPADAVMLFDVAGGPGVPLCCILDMDLYCYVVQFISGALETQSKRDDAEVALLLNGNPDTAIHPEGPDAVKGLGPVDGNLSFDGQVVEVKNVGTHLNIPPELAKQIVDTHSIIDTCVAKYVQASLQDGKAAGPEFVEGDEYEITWNMSEELMVVKALKPSAISRVYSVPSVRAIATLRDGKQYYCVVSLGTPYILIPVDSVAAKIVKL